MTSDDALARTWKLPPAARLGSSVRSMGLYMEVRSQLPRELQKALTVKAGELTLCMSRDAEERFSAALAIIENALVGIENRVVIPREIEDILGITTTERRRWLADGRLPSAGTRTTQLRGRGTITFHVFDPRFVEDILDRNLIDVWREDDAEKTVENRRRAARKTKLKRALGAGVDTRGNGDSDGLHVKLRGWAEFERDGPL